MRVVLVLAMLLYALPVWAAPIPGAAAENFFKGCKTSCEVRGRKLKKDVALCEQYCNCMKARLQENVSLEDLRETEAREHKGKGPTPGFVKGMQGVSKTCVPGHKP